MNGQRDNTGEAADGSTGPIARSFEEGIKQSPEPTSLPRVPAYLTLDAWRGVAALWVVMLHSCLAYIISGRGALLRNPIYLASVWGQLGVTMFFVISGYCITGAAYSSIIMRKPLVRFCRERVRRIYPPYFVSVLCAVLAVGLNGVLQRWHLMPLYRSIHPTSPQSYTFWLANLTLTQVPARQPSLLIVAWSLCYEIVFYIIVAAFLGLGALWKEKEAERLGVLLGGICLFTFGSLVWLCFAPQQVVFPFDLWYQFGLGSILFLCGAVGKFRRGTPGRPVIWMAGGSALTLTALLAALPSPVDLSPLDLGRPSTRVQAITALTFCTLLFCLRSYDQRLSQIKVVKIAMHIGAISYSLYLVHTMVLPYIDVSFRRIGFTDDWYLIPYVVQVLAALAAGWLFFTVIERRFISKKQVRRIALEA